MSNSAIELCEQLAAKAQEGALLRDGMTVVIAGRLNAGKSRMTRTDRKSLRTARPIDTG